MSHVVALLLFSALVSVVFALLQREDKRERIAVGAAGVVVEWLLASAALALWLLLEPGLLRDAAFAVSRRGGRGDSAQEEERWGEEGQGAAGASFQHWLGS